ncbi:MAG: restriction endonuclease subunit S [Lachnospiraceae bacterium]
MGKWEIVRLLDVVVETITGEWGVECTKGEVGTKVLRTTNFTNLGIINYDNVVERIIPEAKIEKKKLARYDIILEKSGGSDNQPVGRVVFFDNNDVDVYLCNNFTQILRIDKSMAFPRYIFLFLFYLHQNGTTELLQNKTTGIRNLQVKQYMALEIPLPPLSVQQQIADVLDRASALIEKRKAQIEKLNLLIKSQFIEMFGDPVTNPKGWDKKTLSQECDVITGNTPPRAISNYYGDYIEWIKSDNINTPDMYLSHASEMLSEAGLSVGRHVEAGAILMTCIAGSISCIGNVAISNRKVSFNQQINAVIPNANNVYYMYYLFLLSKLYIQSTVSMSLKGILSKGKMLELEFSFPPLNLQNEFANFVQQVEVQKSQLKKSLEKLELNYKSLMQKCFRGEIF